LSSLKEKIKSVEMVGNDIEITLNDFYGGFPYTRTTKIDDSVYPVMVWGKGERTWAQLKQMIKRELQNFNDAAIKTREDLTGEFTT